MSKISKIGIAGLGHIGKRHLSHLVAMGVPACTADPMVSAAEALSLGSAAHYVDFSVMLRQEKPDAAIIGLPTPMHRHSAIEALRAGCHVLVEKPLALTVAECEAILAEARACGRRVMAGHVCRFMGQNVLAKEMLESGRLGRPLFLTAWRNVPTPKWSQGGWLGDKAKSGGTVMDLMIHDIDLVQWFFGPAREGTLTERQGGAMAGSGFFHAAASLAFENGAAASLEAGHLMPAAYVFTNGYRLVGEGGALEFFLRGYEPAMYLYETAGMADLTAEYKARWAGHNAYRDELAHFIGCVETGEPFRVGDGDALRAVGAVAMLLGNAV